MEQKTKQEIVPLNRELYMDLSIEELEQRLELDCWGYVCVGECSPLTVCGDSSICGLYYSGGGGGGGGE